MLTTEQFREAKLSQRFWLTTKQLPGSESLSH